MKPGRDPDDGIPVMVACFLCTSQFQFGPHVYRGRYIRRWGISVCSGCFAANHDGIVPETYPHLLKHLEGKGVEIALNLRGWLDFPAA